MTPANPFEADPDRRQIWELLVTRDIAAFVAGNWSVVAADFDEAGFNGVRGAGHPDDWSIAYPDLASYRDDWLRQGQEFNRMELVGESRSDFLHRATRLREIEITGDRAIAHKKFKGVAKTADGADFSLDWQTLYFLARREGGWRITGFVGYLPHPFPAAAEKGPIGAVAEAAQHVTAGPYSPVLTINPGTLIAISGQGPIDPTGAIVGADIITQSRFTLENCRRQLACAGATFAHVFQVRVYLSSMADWEQFNSVYAPYFQSPFPVRTAIEARLWGGILVEIDMMANKVSQ